MGNYLPSTAAERASMLEEMGYESVYDLYKAVPADMFAQELDLSLGKSELEVQQNIRSLANKNTTFTSIFRGAGAYHRFIPPLVKSVMGKESLTTAYTPYQAEISQGVLQSIFEYQTMVCELTGMDASNASIYDGATAAAEAMIMCQERKRSRVVVSTALHPHSLEVMQTYARARDIELTVVGLKDGATDIEAFVEALGEDAACGVFQQPNYFGILEDSTALIEAIHQSKAKAIMAVEPISLGILASPGELGADICVAEGQPLGLPLSFGGPYLGIMTCTKALMRRLPGRIVGQTNDAEGNRAFVLTLQAREQHIRREKASSNVCSNQALCALGAGVYMACMGPEGLAQAAQLSYSKAHYMAEQLCRLDGFDLAYNSAFFNEFVTSCPIDPLELERKLMAQGILCGQPHENSLLWCATEMNSKEQIDEMILQIKKAVG